MKILKVALVVAALGIAAASAPAMAQSSDSESSDVSVTVESTTTVNLAPDSLAYTNSSGVTPGSSDDTSDNGYEGVEVENTGSVNITQVFFNTSHPGPANPGSTTFTESDRPYATGSPSKYDAGNFVELEPVQELDGQISSDASEGYQFASRLDFNVSNDLSYVDEDVDDDSSTTDERYGRIRMANESFFYVIDNAEDDTSNAGNGCGGDGTSTFTLGDNPQSDTQTGSVDFTASGDQTQYTVTSSGSSNYGVVEQATFQTFEGNKDYTVYTWCGKSNQGTGDNTTHTLTNQWEVYDPEGDGDEIDTSVGSREIERVINASSSGSELRPGEYFTTRTRVSVPNGVAEGSVGTGDLEVVVKSGT